jgi:hypothetical protein
VPFVEFRECYQPQNSFSPTLRDQETIRVAPCTSPRALPRIVVMELRQFTPDSFDRGGVPASRSSDHPKPLPALAPDAGKHWNEF